MEGVYIKIRIYLCPWHYCEPKELGEHEVFVKKKVPSLSSETAAFVRSTGIR